MPELGIVIVSHSADIAKGLVQLIREVAPDIPLTATGGLEDGGFKFRSCSGSSGQSTS